MTSTYLQGNANDVSCSRGALGASRAMWQNKWSSDSEQAKELDTPVKVLPCTDYDYYTNTCTLIVILGTLPVTSCECEQSISMLWLVKTALHSTMTETRLNGLAILQYHRDIPLSADEVVQEFVCRHRTQTACS